MKKHKKILLVQFRTDQTEEHEVHCFREAAHLHHEQLNTLNAVKENYTPDILNGHDAVILGGSAQFYLSQGDGMDSWVSNALSLVDNAIEQDIPMLGVCFGYQILGLAFGGRVIRENERREVGIFEITQSDEATNDPLFRGIPEVFDAQLAHKDYLTGLNGDLTYLAKSERVHPQAFRVKGKRAWGVLFHPELNGARMRDRISMFPGYLKPDQSVEDTFWDTPHAEKVVHNFMEVVEQSSPHN